MSYKRLGPFENSYVTGTLCLILCMWVSKLGIHQCLIQDSLWDRPYFCNVIPFTDSAKSPSNVAILCRDPITINSVYLMLVLLEQSQAKICLRSLLISVCRTDKLQAENVKFVSSANDLPVL